MKKFLSLCVGAVGLYLFCASQTDGFSERKIRSELPAASEENVEVPRLDHLLSQPFHYLGHGAQVYAFESEDKTAVLKFYRHNRATHPLKPLLCILPSIWKTPLSRTIEKREAKRLKDFKSYSLAERLLSEETGLLYLHLNKAPRLQQQVTLFDKIGVRHTLNINDFQFILQKKAEHIYPTLENWIASGATETAKAGLTELVNLLKARSEKGIFDKDPDLKTNFGFIDQKVIQFDIGRFKETDPLDKEGRRDELIRITDHLCAWLDQRAPELSTHLRKEIML